MLIYTQYAVCSQQHLFYFKSTHLLCHHIFLHSFYMNVFTVLFMNCADYITK